MQDRDEQREGGERVAADAGDGAAPATPSGDRKAKKKEQARRDKEARKRKKAEKKARKRADKERNEATPEPPTDAPAAAAPAPVSTESIRTLTIDIGGTGIKMIPTDVAGRPLAERARELTPSPAAPAAVMAVVEGMLSAQAPYDRVSVGFPGVVVRGKVLTAPNLGTEHWSGFDLQGAIRTLTGKPTRVLNDADLQGYGVIHGKGVELVLTLGTGLGTALYVNGHLVPNLELGHHPFQKGATYEDRVSNAERQRIGNKRWLERVAEVFAQLEPIFNYDRLFVGGGNAKRLDELPAKVHFFENVEGLAGGVRLWEDEPEALESGQETST